MYNTIFENTFLFKNLANLVEPKDVTKPHSQHPKEYLFTGTNNIICRFRLDMKHILERFTPGYQ
jgi:hypothetical protein